MAQKTKHQFRILILALLFGMSCDAIIMAEPSEMKEHTYLVLQKNGERPNSPSRYYIECFYSADLIEFQLSPTISSIEFEILKNDITVFNGFASQANPVVEIPELTGEVTILCTTDNGHTLSGTLYF